MIDLVWPKASRSYSLEALGLAPMHCRHMLKFNDIHGHVIKTKPTEHFRGFGKYRRKLAG